MQIDNVVMPNGQPVRTLEPNEMIQVIGNIAASLAQQMGPKETIQALHGIADLIEENIQ